MVMPLIDAREAWVAKGRADGTLKAAWAFAGTQAGGGIAEVDSHEQLDAIMAGFPSGPSRLSLSTRSATWARA